MRMPGYQMVHQARQALSLDCLSSYSMVLLVMGLGVVACTGCGGSSVGAERERFELGKMPAEHITIAEAQEACAEADDEQKVTVIGILEAGDQDPFAEGQASFIMGEAPTDAHGEIDDHNVEDCEFCKQKIAEGPLAYVRFLDEAGAKVLDYDARDLFDLRRGQIIVVEGTAKMNDKLEIFTLTAEKIYRVN